MLCPALRNLLQRSSAITEITVPTRPHRARSILRALVQPSAKFSWLKHKLETSTRFNKDCVCQNGSHARQPIGLTRPQETITQQLTCRRLHLLGNPPQQDSSVGPAGPTPTHKTRRSPLTPCTKRTSGATASVHLHRSSEARCVQCVKHQIFTAQHGLKRSPCH